MRGMGAHVLLIEDDERLARQVVANLADAGYETTWRSDGSLLAAEALQGIELVVLDLMLPGVYGLDILKHLRTFSDVPVMVLSARNDTTDKVRALQLGADDYMTKPFWPEELVERVRARLRRPIMERSSVFESGPLRIDRESREVFVRGSPVEVTRVEFEFLNVLAERPGAAITRSMLAQRVLDPERDGDERTLDTHVSRLRKKLGREPIVETVWGIGYRLAHGGNK